RYWAKIMTRARVDRERISRTLTFWLRPAFVLRVLSRFQRVAGFDRAIAGLQRVHRFDPLGGHHRRRPAAHRRRRGRSQDHRPLWTYGRRRQSGREPVGTSEWDEYRHER